MSVADGDLRDRPITIVGANSLRTTDACADSARTTVSVVAGPDSGFTLTLDPRRARLSRLPHADCLTLVDPCISRTPQPLRLDATGAEPAVHVGATTCQRASLHQSLCFLCRRDVLCPCVMRQCEDSSNPSCYQEIQTL